MTGPSQDDLNRFAEIVAVAIQRKEGNEVPEVEVPRRVIDYFNRKNLKGFDAVGYFMYNGVKVFEKGKKDEAVARDNRSMEQILHGGK